MWHFDCSACEKDHSISEDVEVGDVHYEKATGKTIFFDGVGWVPYESTSAMSSTGFWSSKAGPLGPTMPHPILPIFPSPPPEPSEYKFNDIPNDHRRVFIANAIEKHTVDWDTVRCICGVSFYIDEKTDQKDIEWAYSLHIADIAVAATDEWDELQMAGDDEQDQKHSNYDDLA